MDNNNDGNGEAKAPGAAAAAAAAAAVSPAAAAATTPTAKAVTASPSGNSNNSEKENGTASSIKTSGSSSKKGAATAADAGVAGVAAATTPVSKKKKKKSVSAPPSNASGAVKTPLPAGSSGKKEGGATSSAAKSPGDSKTYVEVIHEAIADMKDRTGSSQPAILKWIEQHPTYSSRAGKPTFRKLVNAALKTGLKHERFARVKGSFKISAKWKEKERSKRKSKKRAAAAAAAAAAKKKKQQQQKKSSQSGSKHKQEETKRKMPVTLSEYKAYHKEKLAELMEKDGISEEEVDKEKRRMAKKEAHVRHREEEARKAKERAERIRKRRFPIEDTKLHAEDKELQVKPPPEVTTRPHIPYFWYLTRPKSEREGKTPHQILQNSKVETLDFAGSNGFIPDLLQVYHFFRGDVHIAAILGDEEGVDPVVPEFTLQNLIYAAEQIVTGQARTNRLVPPLIAHLFCVALQILFNSHTIDAFGGDVDASNYISSDTATEVSRRRLQRDLNKYLAPVLSPASFGDW